jgi:hypothetical protein
MIVLPFRRRTCRLRRALALIAWTIVFVSPAVAEITAGHVDDFQNGTTQHWRVGLESEFPKVVPNAGPSGTGDYALFSTNSQQGSKPRLVVLNEANQQFPGPASWQGDWTAAGVAQVSLDVRNPGATAGASNLIMRLGIAGPGGASVFGDVYVTAGQTVPPDDNWYSLTFDVHASDFIEAGSGTDIAAALADVTQFRIFSNPLDEFPGSESPNEFYLDNIRAIGPPAGVPGDYNRNGAVDAADYVLWQDMLGENVPPGTGADGWGPMGEPDGLVNTHDYEFWRARFGTTPAGSAAATASSAVPEPASWLLCTGFFITLTRQSRRI